MDQIRDLESRLLRALGLDPHELPDSPNYAGRLSNGQYAVFSTGEGRVYFERIIRTPAEQERTNQFLAERGHLGQDLVGEILESLEPETAPIEWDFYYLFDPALPEKKSLAAANRLAARFRRPIFL